MRQTLIELQEKIDEFTIVVKVFNTPLSEMDGSSKQKVSEDTVELNSTTNQLDMMGIYKLLT